MIAITFRPVATDDEAQACAALMAASERWLTLGFHYPALLRTVRAPGRECCLAHVEARLAGFIILNLEGTFVGYLQTICVAPEYPGQGCGSQLGALAEDRIFRDHPNVFLCVSSFITQRASFMNAWVVQPSASGRTSWFPATLSSCCAKPVDPFPLPDMSVANLICEIPCIEASTRNVAARSRWRNTAVDGLFGQAELMNIDFLPTISATRSELHGI